MDKKSAPWIILGILLFLLILCGTIFFLTRPSNNSVTINRSPLASPAATPQTTPTLASTLTKVPLVTGSIWAITKIEENAYARDGFIYDIGIFTNIETGQTLRAQCAEPQWPSPPLGTEYRLNQVGVLIPVHENRFDPYQRFIVLSY